MNDKRRSRYNRLRLVMLAVSFLLAPFAFATGPDTSGITDAITTYAAAGVAVVIAFLVARWGIHALGLLRPKG